MEFRTYWHYEAVVYETNLTIGNDVETCKDSNQEIKTDKIDKVEEWFEINIHIYTQDEKDHAENDRRNSGKFDQDIYLSRHNNHFCWIKDIKAFIHSFRCRKCGKSFQGVKSCGNAKFDKRTPGLFKEEWSKNLEVNL